MSMTYPTTAPGADWKSFLDCPLCLQTFKSPVATACGHVFCADCLAQTLISSQQCPLCRAPCYLQPNYTLGRKPLVVIERLVEAAFGANFKDNTRDAQSTSKTPFRLGLFLFHESSVSLVPGSVFRFRAFEPYVLTLVRRCVSEGVRMGIQPRTTSGHGLLIRVESVSPFPDRFHSHHLLVQCHVEGLYKTVGEAEEEPNTGGLFNVLVEAIDSTRGKDDPEIPNLVESARTLFERAVKQLDMTEVTSVLEDVYSGAMRAIPTDPVDLSFFLIETLHFPKEEGESLLFEPNVKARLASCIQVLSQPEPQFKKVLTRRLWMKSRDRLDFSRNFLLASGMMVFVGIVLGGFETILPLFKRQ